MGSNSPTSGVDLNWALQSENNATALVTALASSGDGSSVALELWFRPLDVSDATTRERIVQLALSAQDTEGARPGCTADGEQVLAFRVAIDIYGFTQGHVVPTVCDQSTYGSTVISESEEVVTQQFHHVVIQAAADSSSLQMFIDG